MSLERVVEGFRFNQHHHTRGTILVTLVNLFQNKDVFAKTQRYKAVPLSPKRMRSKKIINNIKVSITIVMLF